jgi:hypothetical protein
MQRRFGAAQFRNSTATRPRALPRDDDGDAVPAQRHAHRDVHLAVAGGPGRTFPVVRVVVVPAGPRVLPASRTGSGVRPSSPARPACRPGISRRGASDPRRTRQSQGSGFQPGPRRVRGFFVDLPITVAAPALRSPTSPHSCNSSRKNSVGLLVLRHDCSPKISIWAVSSVRAANGEPTRNVRQTSSGTPQDDFGRVGELGGTELAVEAGPYVARTVLTLRPRRSAMSGTSTSLARSCSFTGPPPTSRENRRSNVSPTRS